MAQLARDTDLEGAEIAQSASESAKCAIPKQFLDDLPDVLLAIDADERIVFANPAAEKTFGYPPPQLIGQPLRRIIVDWNPVAVSRLIGVGEGVEAHGPAGSMELRGRRQGGKLLCLEVSVGWTTEDGQRRMLLLVRDVSARKRAERRSSRQTAELVAVNAELSALYEISSVINRTMDLEALLHEVLETVTKLQALQVEPRGSIFLVEGEMMRLVTQIGHPRGFIELHQQMKLGTCLCGQVARSGQTLICGNCENDPRHTGRYEGMRPHGHVVVPLKASDRVLGVICLYVSPDVDVDELTLRTLETAGNQIGVAIANARLYEAARQLSLHDPLTGLANRRLMDLFLERNLAQTRRSNSPFSVIMLDVDHFKRFNDTHGHAAGDDLLVQLSEVITQTIRDADLAARYGGEEFLLLLPDIDVNGACEVAERLRRSVKAATGVTVSLGVASYRQTIRKSDDLIEEADQMMYRAKRGGRNRVEVSR